MPGSLGSIQFVLQHYSVGREFFRHPAADEEWWRGKEGEPQEVLLRTAALLLQATAFMAFPGCPSSPLLPRPLRDRHSHQVLLY